MDPGEVELLRSWLTKAADDLAAAAAVPEPGAKRL
jgi:hypothetical protein